MLRLRLSLRHAIVGSRLKHNVTPDTNPLFAAGRRFGSTSRTKRRQERKTLSGFVPGPPIQLGSGQLARHTYAHVVGTAGDTVLTAAISHEDLDSNMIGEQRDLLTVNYRQREHGLGQIPMHNRFRQETVATSREILRARPIDRALRPLCPNGRWHVECSVQSTGLGHATALAITASAVGLDVPVAATFLGVSDEDGVVRQDGAGGDDDWGLLYAATADGRVVCMEWTSAVAPMPEEDWKTLLNIAQTSLIPIFAVQEEFRALRQEKETPNVNNVYVPTVGVPEARVEDLAEKCRNRIQDDLDNFFGIKTKNGARYLAAATAVHQGELVSKAERGVLESAISDDLETLLEKELMEEEVDSLATTLRDQVKKKLFQETFHRAVNEYGVRSDHRGVDGSGWKTVRPVSLTVPALPGNVHGSAVFRRGDTQVLSTATLGPPREAPPVSSLRTRKELASTKASNFADSLPVGSLRFLRTQEAILSDYNSNKVKADAQRTGETGSLSEIQRCWLQYDFPSYSTGTVPGLKSSSFNRRTIGHSALAERALFCILPPAENFPYAVRLSSEVTDSNGSSSMATVSGAVLALLDAGVPIQEAVCGVSVGCTLPVVNDNKDEGVADDNCASLLLDLTGTEDHYGGMDFKIAGTDTGVTAFQLDVKTPISTSVLIEALFLAREGRQVMLQKMNELTQDSLGGLKTRPHLKESAPRVAVVRFDPQRKRDLVGPGGVVLRQLEQKFDVSLDLTQEGQCLLFGIDRHMVAQAKTAIMELVADVVEGEVYTGTVVEIKDFGAIIELLRNKEGILHVSELFSDGENLIRNHPEGAIGYVNDFLQVGQEIEVLCTGIDPVEGSIRLSRKRVLQER